MCVVHVCWCGGQHLTLGVFLDCLAPYTLGQGLPGEPRAPWFCCQAGHIALGVSRLSSGSRKLNSGPHPASVLPAGPYFKLF